MKKLNLNLTEFAELNIRIQKSLIQEFNLVNALNSALTDWFREVNNLMADSLASRKESRKPLKKEKDPFLQISDQIINLPFESICSQEKYMALFKINS